MTKDKAMPSNLGDACQCLSLLARLGRRKPTHQRISRSCLFVVVW